MDFFNRLDDIATPARLIADGVPSASIAILEDGEITSHVISVHGTENTETVYQAASISKAITGLAVARLVDEGRLTYDSKVAQHLPESVTGCIVQPETAHLIQHVTVGMLLSHTSGLSQHGWHGYVDKVPKAEDILAGRAPSNTPKVRFDSFPGSQHSYSGAGFLVLQLFLEHLTGKDFATLMQETILGPLAMTRSHFGVRKEDEKNYATSHFTAYVPANAPNHVFPELASGAMWTTPSDLLKAIWAVQQSLKAEGGFLRQDTAKKMLTARPGTDGIWALGWGVDDSVFAHRGTNYPGYTCYASGSHGGVVNGKSDSTLKVPAGCGVAIMTNSVSGDEAFRKTMSAVFYLKGWRRFGSLAGTFGRDDEYIPYALPDKLVAYDDVRGWAGKWERGWEFKEDDGRMKLSFQGFEGMNLLRAAAPVQDLGFGKLEHIFVADGLSLALRLTWEGDERLVELLQEEVFSVAGRILRRVS